MREFVLTWLLLTNSSIPPGRSARPALPALPALAARPAVPAQASPPKRKLFEPNDLGLLDAPDRDQWQKPEQIMDTLGIAEGSKVADIGIGSGWFTVRLARRVGPNGLAESAVARDLGRGVRQVRVAANLPTDRDVFLLHWESVAEPASVVRRGRARRT